MRLSSKTIETILAWRGRFAERKGAASQEALGFGTFIDTLLDAASMNGTRSGTAENGTDCHYAGPPYIQVKFVLVVFLGTSTALIGIIGNTVLIFYFSRLKAPTATAVYFGALAACDILFAIVYILLFPLEILYDYFKSLELFYAWHSYLRFCFGIGHLAQAMCNYLVIAAATERYVLLVCPRKVAKMCSRNSGLATVTAIVLSAFLFRGATFWELDVRETGCADFASLVVRGSALSQNVYYAKIYRLWIYNIVQIFMPFLILVWLNISITWYYWRATRKERLLKLCRLEKIAKERWKDLSLSTKCLVIMVTNHLFCNMVNLVITILEQSNYDFLMEHPMFYVLGRDAVSYSAVLNSALRFAIYLISNPTMRRELWALLRPGSNFAESLAREKDMVMESRKRRERQLMQTFGFLPIAPMEMDLSSNTHNNAPPHSNCENSYHPVCNSTVDNFKVKRSGSCNSSSNCHHSFHKTANSHSSDDVVWL